MCCWHLRVSLHLEASPSLHPGNVDPGAGMALAALGTHRDTSMPPQSSRKIWKMDVSIPQTIARNFLLFVKDNVIIIIPLKRKKKEMILKYI